MVTAKRLFAVVFVELLATGLGLAVTPKNQRKIKNQDPDKQVESWGKEHRMRPLLAEGFGARGNALRFPDVTADGKTTPIARQESNKKSAKKAHKLNNKDNKRRIRSFMRRVFGEQKGRNYRGKTEILACGAVVPESWLGLNLKKHSNGIFSAEAALLEVSNPEAAPTATEKKQMAMPGAGASQAEAKFASGYVSGEEIFVRVYKDGFFRSNCIKDKMFHFHDKYGHNKGKYDTDDFTNTSIVHYDYVMEDTNEVAMTPQACFSLCRTVPHMGFFGITNGNKCYCSPYYIEDKLVKGGEEKCNVPCAGRPTEFCGGKDASSVFEMHSCNDIPQQLKDAATKAAEALELMYDTDFVGVMVSEDLQASGDELDTVAGLGGDPTAADLGQLAKVTAGNIEKSMMDGECFQAYKSLLDTYRVAEELHDLDYTLQENLLKADDAMAMIQRQTPVVRNCAKKGEAIITESMPFYFQDLTVETQEEWEQIELKRSKALPLYVPALTIIDPMGAPTMSTCTGNLVHAPGPLTMSQCAEFCDQTRYPTKCLGFQFFLMGGQAGSSSPKGPLCYLFQSIEAIQTYKCPFIESLLAEVSNVSKGNSTNATSGNLHHLSSLRGYHGHASSANRKMNKEAIAHAHQQAHDYELAHYQAKKAGKLQEDTRCTDLRETMFYFHSTCDDILPAGSEYWDLCPQVCENSEGAKISASCMVKLSDSAGLKGRVTVRRTDRCFGGESNQQVEASGDGAGQLFSYDADGIEIPASLDIGGPGDLESVWDHMWTD